MTDSAADKLITSETTPVNIPVVPWFLNGYLILLAGGLLDAAGELLLKKGAITKGQIPVSGILHLMATVFKLPPLGSGWTWIGICCYILGLLCYLQVLKTIPLSIAFPVVNGLHMLVPIGARFLLHEDIHLKRWLGIGLALAGVLLILRPVARAEEKL